jgi:hypothetical protein
LVRDPMSLSFKYCLSVIARDVDLDVRLNGMSVVSTVASDQVIVQLQCHAYLVTGWNRIEVLSNASRETIDAERTVEVTLSRPLAWEDPDDQDIVVRYQHADHAAAHGGERLREALRFDFMVKEDVGLWAFKEARPIADADRPSMEKALNSVLASLRNRDLKGFLKERALVTTEEALGGNLPRDDREDEVAEAWGARMAESDFAVHPRSLGALQIDPRLNSRVACLRHDDGRAFATGVAGGKTWLLPMTVGYVDGNIRWVR